MTLKAYKSTQRHADSERLEWVFVGELFGPGVRFNRGVCALSYALLNKDLSCRINRMTAQWIQRAAVSAYVGTATGTVEYLGYCDKILTRLFAGPPEAEINDDSTYTHMRQYGP